MRVIGSLPLSDSESPRQPVDNPPAFLPKMYGRTRLFALLIVRFFEFG